MGAVSYVLGHRVDTYGGFVEKDLRREWSRIWAERDGLGLEVTAAGRVGGIRRSQGIGQCTGKPRSRETPNAMEFGAENTKDSNHIY